MFFFGLTSVIPDECAARPTVDEALLPRIAAGDQEALAELYHQTDRAVYGFILSIIQNRQDAQDLLQDTYLQIYRSAGTYRPQGKPLAWILTIARNLALMRIRAARELPTAAEELPEPPPSPGNQAAEDRIMLQAALQLLGEEERQIVLLHATAGLRHREIASLLELPLSTVLSRYSRALGKLRNYWNEGGK